MIVQQGWPLWVVTYPRSEPKTEAVIAWHVEDDGERPIPITAESGKVVDHGAYLSTAAERDQFEHDWRELRAGGQGEADAQRPEIEKPVSDVDYFGEQQRKPKTGRASF